MALEYMMDLLDITILVKVGAADIHITELHGLAVVAVLVDTLATAVIV
jgi:hypothetical protein